MAISQLRYPYTCTYGFSFLVILSSLYCVDCLDAKQNEVMQNLSTISKSWSRKKSSGKEPCNWQGVSCENDSVVSISASGMRFNDNPWNSFCKLESLELLDVSCTALAWLSSDDLKACTSLQTLNISYNFIVGRFPSLESLRNLRILDASFNKFQGDFGSQIQGLLELNILNLGSNFLTSEENSFPKEILRCTNLTILDLSMNKFTGTIPESIGNLSSLQTLALSSNNLSGEIPQTLGRLTNLSSLELSSNSFSGSVPPQLAFIPGLQNLRMNLNNLSGEFPAEIFGMESLVNLDVSNNKLEGSLPEDISAKLKALVLGKNRFQGPIPSSIGNLSDINYLEMNDNYLHGPIPANLWKCTRLLSLDLSNNKLEGDVPPNLGSLAGLQVLRLARNNLSGSILNEISSISNLSYIDLSHNLFSEQLSPKVFELRILKILFIGNNNLFGNIPANINGCRSLTELRLGRNNLSGSIPDTIGQLNNLQNSLNLSYNSLQGRIPSSLASLNMLLILDLSNNNLTGRFEFLMSMNSLTVLNISNNRLTGRLDISNNRTKSNLTLIYAGNPDICNISCISQNAKSKNRSGLVIGVAVGAAAVVLIGLSVTVIMCRYHGFISKAQRPVKIKGEFVCSDTTHKESINFEKAIADTQDRTNVVLEGKICVYYKSTMPSGVSYLVKKLNWTDKMLKTRNYQKLAAELEKQGKSIEHPNIMTPLAYVLHRDCAFLFYTYMHKGTLSEFLHGNNVTVLDWSSRRSIAIGAAEGLAFLHSCQQPILHHDLSSRNIFLRSSVEPQIGEIELCKMIRPFKSTGSASAVAGSVGYIPPEYAYTMRITAAGNVYSFGVILLELLSGRPPITGGVGLATWVQSTRSQHQSCDLILDSKINNSELVKKEMTSMLKIALQCVSTSPNSRPYMRDVRNMLQTINSDS